MFENMTLRAKTAAGFIVVGCLVAVISGVGLRQTKAMHDDAKDIYEREVSPMRNVSLVLYAAANLRANAFAALQHDPASETASLHDHAIDVHLEQIRLMRALISEQAEHYMEVKLPPEDADEAKMRSEIMDIVPVIFKASGEVLKELESGDYKEANVATLKKMNPSIKKLDKIGEPLLELLSTRAFKENNAGDKEYRSLVVMLSSLAGVCLVICAGIWFYLARAIKSSIADVNGVVTRIASGDLRGTIHFAGREEFNGIKAALHDMQSSLVRLISNIHDTANRVESNAAEISMQMRGAAQGTQKQNGEVMQVSAAMEEMTAAIEGVSQNAGNVKSASDDAMRNAENGAKRMQGNIATVDRVVSIVTESSASIHDLCATTKQIGSLADTIKEIAEQTNLLALNAAIEAARAGDTGRGFAVVADEVRKLAERTSESSAAIGNLLGSVNDKTDHAIESMRNVTAGVNEGADDAKEVGKYLEEILGANYRVRSLSEEIAVATQQQSSAAHQTAHSMEGISAMSDEQNASIQRVSVSADEMKTLAEQLQKAVSSFQI